MGTDNSLNAKETKAMLDYLKELLTDRTILASDPHVYIHLGKILEQEILRIRSSLFSAYGIYTITDNELPEPEGPKVNLQTKVYMPTDPTNTFNFVGRILGPDGSTAKCLQQCLGVKIMVRGRGSMRDRKKEEANTGKPNWEHLNDNLHVVLTVEDFENRAKARLAKASEYINLFLKESMKGSDKEDKVKQMQLMELSFRREPRPSWHFNCGSLFDMTLPPKPGALFPNAAAAANLLGFGYGYPTASLFSPLQHNSHHHHHHFGPLTQPPPQQHHQPHPGPSLSAPGTNPHNHLAALPHPLHSNLGPAALLMGHGLGTGGYPSPYSPNGHTHASIPTTTSLPGGSLAVTQLNYWSGQNLSQLPPDYGVTNSSTNGYSAGENNNLPLVNDAPSSQAPTTNGTTLFLPQHLPRTGHDDSLPQCIFSELASCDLDGSKDSVTRGMLNNGLRTSLHGNTTNHQSKVKGGTTATLGSTGSLGGASKHGLKPRYSQKHVTQSSPASGHGGNSESTVSRNHGRAAVVTVKVGGNERTQQTKPVVKLTGTHELNGSVKESKKSDGNFERNPVNGDSVPNCVSATSTGNSGNPLTLRGSGSESEWPTLGASLRNKSTVDLTTG